MNKTKNIADIYPLSPLQQGILFHSLYAPSSTVYFTTLSWRLSGALDIDAFERAWQLVLERHDVLRTAFAGLNLETPMQIVLRQVRVPFERHDWRTVPDAEQEERFARLLEEDRQRGFDFAKPPLMRLTLVRLKDQEQRLIWSSHHLLFDGWSTPILLNEVFAAYQAFSRNEQPKLPAARPYRDYVAWLQRQDAGKAETYWRERLAGFVTPTRLGVDRAITDIQGADESAHDRHAERHGEYDYTFTVSIERLERFSRQHKLTVNTLAQGIWALLLSRYSGSNDVVFGVTISGRPAELPEAETRVGLFINTLPLRLSISPVQPVLAFLHEVQGRQAQLLEYQHSSLIDVQKWSEVPPGTTLFASRTVFENYPSEIPEAAGMLQSLSIGDVNLVSRSHDTLHLAFLSKRAFSVRVIYDAGRFEPEVIIRLARHFDQLLQAIVENPEQSLGQLQLPSAAEKRQLMDWSVGETQPAWPNQYFHETFAMQAARTPHAIAVECDGEQLSYAELDRRSNQLARYLQNLGVGQEVVVGICAERSCDMIVAILGVWKAGGAYLPLDSNAPAERLQFMLQDAGVSILLTQAALEMSLPASLARVVLLDEHWSDIARQPATAPAHGLTPENLAYVIYTSGSTGKPKGTLLLHRGLSNLSEMQAAAYGVQAGGRVLQFARLSFDASVSEIVMALRVGATLCLPKTIARSAVFDVRQMLLDSRITAVTLPPSVLASLSPANGSSEFPALELMLVAGEACPVELAQPWIERCRFVNAYGPTEATVCAAFTECISGEPLSIGGPIANARTYVLDEELQPVPAGVAGELYIGGPGLARGYLNRPGLTADRFIADPFGHGTRLYRSGDRVKYRADGRLEFIGRVDQQVKIRGHRIELGEIESVMLEHSGVKQAVALAREDTQGEKRLALYLTLQSGHQSSVQELQAFCERTMPGYMLPSSITVLDELPLTAHGKVNRQVLPAPDLQPQISYEAPSTALEQALAQIWTQVLKVERVGVHDNFFELGGDSIRALRVQAEAQKQGYEFALVDLFKAPQIRQLASVVVAGNAVELSHATPFGLLSAADRERALQAGYEDAYPLSMLQTGMVFHNLRDRGGKLYHAITVHRLAHPLNEQALHTAVQAVVDRHPVLRTTFHLHDYEAPLQCVHRHMQAKIEVADWTHLTDEALRVATQEFVEAEVSTEFDLGHGPLIRFFVHRIGAEMLQFTLSSHHAILDGWSDAAVLTEIYENYLALLTNRALPKRAPLLTNYHDFVVAEQDALQDREHERYWRGVVDGIEHSHAWRLCKPLKAQDASYASSRVSHPFSKEMAEGIVAFSRKAQVPVKSVLFAAHLNTLRVLMGSREAVTGLVANARPEMADSDKVLGLFLNTVPVRWAGRAESWCELARRARAVEEEFMSHRAYPVVNIYRGHGKHKGEDALDVIFNYVNFHVIGALQGQLHTSHAQGVDEASVPITNFPLSVNAGFDVQSMRGNVTLSFHLERIDAVQAQRFVELYLLTLKRMIQQPQERCDAQPLLSERDQALQLGWNETRASYPEARCIHELIADQTARTADAVALIYEGQHLTYAQLEQRTDAFARRLRAHGAGPEVVVGLFMHRSLDMVIGLLGVLKSGAAYLPLDPDLPSERLSYMIQDAGTRLVVTHAVLAPALASQQLAVVCVDDDGAEPEQPAAMPASRVTPDNLAYVLYTSGSTGRPKAAMNSHRALVNRLHWMQAAYELTSRDRVLQKTPYSFDVSIWEFLWPLITGATLVIARPEGHKDPLYLSQTVERYGITVMHFVPSMLELFLEHGELTRCTSLRRLIVSGEALPAAVAMECLSRLPARLENLYGPTESAIDVSSHTVTAADSASVPIGTPISNVQLYLLDADLQPIAIGVTGELYIGGLAVGRGYRHRPGLTAERFIADPFGNGDRMYRTGDLARYRVDGKLEFVGRVDTQVKIRGQRVELEEIEAMLREHPRVGQAAVTMREDESRQPSLVAYVVQAAAQQDEDSLHSSWHRLPNGLTVAQLNGHETRAIYNEVFKDDIYLAHGITLDDDCCVFDVGANIGLFTLRVHQHCANARVYAFEPAPPTFAKLQANIEHYGLPAKAFPYGLSNRAGSAQIHFYPNMSGNSSLYADEAEEMAVTRSFLNNILGDQRAHADAILEGKFESEVFSCELTTISAMLQALSIEVLDLLKIDVEKSEWDVLAGIAAQDWGRIRQIVLEVHDLNNRVQQVRELLQSQGFDCVVEQRRDLEGTGLYQIYAINRALSRPRGVATAQSLQPKRHENSALADELRQHLQARLPQYMVPSVYVDLEAMPLTVSGKLDRRALPAPGLQAQLARRHVAPRTPLEETLVAIWKQVLQLESVGIHDNFFELGGDSIHSIKIIARASRAELKLTLQQIFEEQTIARIARVVSQSTPVEAEQGLVEGEVQLTPIQQWFFETGLRSPHHFNQVVMLRSQRPLDAQRLSAALNAIFKHHDALRLRFWRDDGHWRQEHAPYVDNGAPFEYIDLRNLAAKDRLQRLTQDAQRLQTSFDLAQGNLLRAALFELGAEHGQRLLLVVHHLAMDGVSWRIVLEDLRTAYEQLVRDEPVVLPAKTSSYRHWAKCLSNFAQQESARAELAYWEGLPWAQVARLPVDHQHGVNSVASARVIATRLDEHETQALLQEVPRAYHTQINDVLLTALAQALGEWQQSSHVLIDLEGHGREELFDNVDVSRTVGWFTSVFPVLICVESTDPGESLRSVKEQLRRIPRRGVGYGILRYLSGVAQLAEVPPAQVSFNYMGQFDEESSPESLFQFAGESVGASRSVSDRRRHVLDINSSVAGGRLQLSWAFSSEIHEQATVAAIAERFMQRLRAIIAHCRYSEARFTPSDFPLVQIEQAALDKVLSVFKKDVGEVADIYPLSPLQHGILFHSLYAPHAALYFLTLSWRLRGALNVAAFERAWQHLVERHEVLRTAFVGLDLEVPLQVIMRRVDLPIERQDWRHLSHAQQEQRLQAFLQEDRTRGFDFAKPPLMRVALLRLAEDEHQLIWSSHHALLDGWSTPILLNEMFAAYLAFSRGEQPQWSPVRPYRNYIAWLQRQDSAKAEAYWRDRLAGFLAATSLGLERSSVDNSTGGGEYKQTFSIPLAHLESFAREHKVTVNTLAQCVWALLLSHYSGQDDVVFGVTLSGRPAELPDADGQVGLFINTLPLRVTLPEGQTVTQLLQQVQRRQAELFEYQYSPLVDVQRYSALPPGEPLFTSLFVFENYPVEIPQAAGAMRALSIDDVRVMQKPHYPLTLLVEAKGALSLRVIFDEQRLDAEAVQRLAGHFEVLLRQLVAHPNWHTQQLSPVGESERLHLLRGAQGPRPGGAKSQCIHEMFTEQARRTPDAVALSYCERQLSYEQLEHHANQWAHYLRKRGVGRGAVVGLCLERSPEMIVAMLGILKAGAVCLPLDADYPVARLESMLASSAYLLTQASQSGKFADCSVECMQWEQCITQVGEQSTSSPDCVVDADDLAYIIYTSGSTGKPKGVMMPHRALVNLVAWHTASYPAGSGAVLQLTPLSFDVAFQEIFISLVRGRKLVLVDNDIRLDPRRLLQVLQDEEIHDVFAPQVILDQLAGEAESHAQLQLPLRNFFQAGEPLRISSAVHRLLQAGTQLHLHNHYGPTETHVATAFTVPPGAGSSTAPIGRPIANACAYVLDSRLELVPLGIVGELYLGGEGLARGYLQRPGLTAERFIADPFGQRGGRLYRTGDLARYRLDGTLEFVGRADNQVKIRGYRVEPGEIEAALLDCPGVAQAAVLARDDVVSGEMGLVAYVVSNTGSALPIEALRMRLLQNLPTYMIPAAWMQLGSLPLTPSGKVNRQSLPAPQERLTAQECMPARTAIEASLVSIWARVLKLERVGVNDDFFALGGHSLLATRMTAQVREVFQVELPLRSVFEMPTITDIARQVEELLLTRDPVHPDGNSLAVMPLPQRPEGHLPLSFAQERLWFLDRLGLVGSAYNMPAALRLEGALDVIALQSSFAELMRRHEVLRSRFDEVGGKAVQIIDEPGSFNLALIDLSHLPSVDQQKEVARLTRKELSEPFNLDTDVLLRVRLIRLATEDHVMLITLHHIICDGWSVGVLIRELSALYTAYTQKQSSPLAELPMQYGDYALWQRAWLQGPVLQRQLDYWREQLADAPLALELPTDRPRPAIPSFEGAMVPFMLPKEVSTELYALAQRTGTTLFMIVLSAFQLVLSRWSGQQDIVVGSPIAGRRHSRIEGLIGFFVNTVALRTRLEDNLSFAQLLGRVKETALNAYTHQDIPFEKLVAELQPERDLSRQPIFQAAFGLLNVPREDLTLPGLKLGTLRSEQVTAKFDLSLYIQESAGLLTGALEYATDLFDGATIERFADHLRQTLHAAAADPEFRLSQLDLLGVVERAQLAKWSRSERDYDRSGSVHALIAQQAARTPHAIAVVCGSEQLTYAQLDARSNQLAHLLVSAGVGPEQVVGLCVERSAQLVVALLAIMKTGAAYLPLDPSYPRDRLGYMLSDSGASILLTQTRFAELLPAVGLHVIDLDTQRSQIAAQPESPVPACGDAQNLAYIIYTSGSTGTPKGVMISRQALRNLILAMEPALELTAQDVFAAVTPVSFDISALEIYLPLTVGAQLLLIPRVLSQDGFGLADYLIERHATALQATPSTWSMLFAAGWRASKMKIICGGEALPPRLAGQCAAQGAAIYNMYGPTETTVWSAAAHLRPGERICIGHPIANTRMYVLDDHLRPAPIGVPGELYIGGDGVARGYHGRAGLTAERFIAAPFGKGERLYRTGDLVRYLSDGALEFIGRKDAQIKLRGYRIELGEVEALLCEQPAVREAAAVLREDEQGDPRLVAYVVADQQQLKAEQDGSEQQRTDIINQWQQLWSDTYESGRGGIGSAHVTSPSSALEPTVPSFVGWKSSYTGMQIPEAQMQEWLHQTAARISALRPRRLLEIGCGVGLLVERLAPQCERYLGTDFSQAAITQLGGWLHDRPQYSHVELQRRSALQLNDLEPGTFDTVVLNSVVQYFPDIEYLVAVLDRAVRLVGAGGQIFIGDVRHLESLSAFHASTLAVRAEAGSSVAQLRARLARAVREEKELVVDPEFFFALREHLPDITAVRVQLKRGNADNELTRYRYDVTLGVGSPSCATPATVIEWQGLEASLQRAHEHCQKHGGPLTIAGIPNCRMSADTRFIQALEGAANTDLLSDLQKRVLGMPLASGPDPEILWRWGEEHGVQVALAWTPGTGGRCFDMHIGDVCHETVARPWGKYATDPGATGLQTHLASCLRQALRQRLPEYMVPAAFVSVETLPLTPNGKVDRKALVAPEVTRSERGYVAPRNDEEEMLAGIWAELFKLDRVGIHDNFFELGGHSLLLISLVAKVWEKGCELVVVDAMENPQLSSMARILKRQAPSSMQLPPAQETVG